MSRTCDPLQTGMLRLREVGVVPVSLLRARMTGMCAEQRLDQPISRPAYGHLCPSVPGKWLAPQRHVVAPL